MPRVVDWGTKPGAKKKAAAVAALDSLVLGQAKRTKRLNAEIPADLHTRIKTQCAADGKDMTEALIEILEARFPQGR